MRVHFYYFVIYESVVAAVYAVDFEPRVKRASYHRSYAGVHAGGVAAAR